MVETKTKIGMGVVPQRDAPTLEMRARPEFTNLVEGLMIDDKYELVKHLGQGGMGTVYKARQIFEDDSHGPLGKNLPGIEGKDKYVAVKFLPPFDMEVEHMTPEQITYMLELRKQFEFERRITVNLVHDNIVRAHDYGTYEGIPYYVQDFIDGYELEGFMSRLFRMNRQDTVEQVIEDLLTLEENNAIRPPDQVVGFIGWCTAEALTDANNNSLVHGDVSPDNIFIASKHGFIKLGDFGAARSQATIKRDGKMLVGKLPYMAPEIMTLSREPDIRADIFSLGMTLYQLILGVSPNTPFNPSIYYADQLSWIPYITALNDYCGEILPPHKVVEGVDERLSMIIAKMIAIDPDDRYQTPDDLVRELGKDFLYTGGFGITKKQFARHIEFLENPAKFNVDPNDEKYKNYPGLMKKDFEELQTYFQNNLRFLQKPVSKRHQDWFEQLLEHNIPPLWKKFYGDRPVWKHSYFPEEKRRLTAQAKHKLRRGLNPCRSTP